MSKKRLLVAAAALVAATLGGSAVAVAATETPTAGQVSAATPGFVTRSGSHLELNGKVFHFVGSNNYYLMYKSRLMVDDVFADAQAAGFNWIRTWGFLDIGNQDGSNSIRGSADGVYFQYFDPATNHP